MISIDLIKKSREKQLKANAEFEQATRARDLAKEAISGIEQSRSSLETDLKRESDRYTDILANIRLRYESQNYSSVRYYKRLKKECKDRQVKLAESILRLDNFEIACDNYKKAKAEMHKAYQEAIKLKEELDKRSKPAL